jgi:hypothetical protein
MQSEHRHQYPEGFPGIHWGLAFGVSPKVEKQYFWILGLKLMADVYSKGRLANACHAVYGMDRHGIVASKTSRSQCVQQVFNLGIAPC